jgi:Na+-transporting methylmalonyl-CoA/oxaloacetate decarboxylase gamma subunit
MNMTVNSLIALQITAIGMSLVFASIILLWIMMAILVRLTAEKEVNVTEVKEDNKQVEMDKKKKAAIAAVVVALAREAETELHEFPLPPTAIVSAWQAVNRSDILKKRGRVR